MKYTKIHSERRERHKTNTFGANTAVYPDFDTVKAIIKAGFRRASKAAGTDCAVFADIGPIKSDSGDKQAEYVEIVKTFLEEGAVNFLFETLSEVDGISSAVEYIKSKVKNPQIIVSFAVLQDGYTTDGEFFIRLFDKAKEIGADYTGLNCLCGPAHMLELISRCDTSKYKISAMPNAGYPSVVGGRLVYVDNPSYFAEKLRDIRSRGACILGGCCGTTPEHIAAAAALLDKPFTISKPVITPPTPVVEKREPETGRKLIAVEIDPPTDTDASFLLDASRKAKAFGADFITLADSPLARTRADSFALAAKVQREVGIKTIPHLCCRDKNQIAIKAQLLAGSIEGISNVLVVTGDPITKEDRPGLNDVFGFNSYKLINFINNLNSDVFRASPYTVYGALNINSANFNVELKRAEEKIKNGAAGLFSQPVYSNTHIENLRTARKSLPCKIFAGILPFASYKNALF